MPFWGGLGEGAVSFEGRLKGDFLSFKEHFGVSLLSLGSVRRV